MSVSLRIRRGVPLPVRRQIAAQLERAILDGHLPAGRRLPSLRSLGTELGVHRNTVAAAYRELERAGLVRLAPGSGAFVRSLATPADAPATQLRRLIVQRRREGGQRELVARFAAWVAAFDERRVAVVDEEPDLLDVLTREVARLIPDADVIGVPLADARVPGALSGRLPVARPAHLADARCLLPPWQECFPLRARIAADLEARIAALPTPATLAVATRSRDVHRWLREVAWRAHGEALGFLRFQAGERVGTERAARLADLVLADVLALPRLPLWMRRRCLEVRLVDRAALYELWAALAAARIHGSNGADGPAHAGDGRPP